MNEKNPLLRLLTQRLFLLLTLANLLAYSLGVGVAHYLGIRLDTSLYLAGQLLTLCLMTSGYILNEFYEPRSVPPTGPDARRRQSTLLVAGLAFFTAATILTVVMLRAGFLSPAALIVLGAGAAAVAVLVLPPFRFLYSGAGELILAFQVSLIIPAFSYSLLAEELHRYIMALGIPLALIFLAAVLVQQFASYERDFQELRPTLLVRIGWQRAWHLHNILLVLAFGMLASAGFQGIPWRILLPVTLLLPVAAWQVFLMTQLADGKRPQWRLLQLSSLTLVGLGLYLLAFMFWIN